MVLQKAVDNLKDKPKDDRKAVAGGIAVAVVAVLFFGWAFLFLKKLQNTSIQGFDEGAQSEFNFSSVRDAQRELLENYSGQSANDAELRAIRDQAAANQYPQPATAESQEASDPFSH